MSSFKRNIRQFGQKQGRVGTKFVKGVDKMSHRNKTK
jgi:hypothetical protein